MRWMVADGRRLPFRDGAFDVVFSNAVIEHVGRFDKQRLFAEECRRVGKSYFVTTPNRGFPIEPHLLTPFVHWLPRRMLTRKLLRFGTLWGLMRNPPVEELDDYTQNIWLLDERQMRHLFPDAEIRRERLMGMTKTLIAAKRDNGAGGERSRQEGGEHISA
jgi:SAM-dependent methyltransferase